MISKAGKTRVVKRLAETTHHGAVVFTIAEEGLYFRQKGRRKSYLLPYGYAFQMAAKLYAARLAAEKREARKEARKHRPRGF